MVRCAAFLGVLLLQESSSRNYVEDVAFFSTTHLVVTTHEGIVITSMDRGETWTRSAARDSLGLRDVVVDQDDVLWALPVGYSIDDPKVDLRVSADAGGEWSAFEIEESCAIAQEIISLPRGSLEVLDTGGQVWTVTYDRGARSCSS